MVWLKKFQKDKQKEQLKVFYTRNCRNEVRIMNNLSINMGDTAFMILCTALVCLMTPGLAFFYGGLARKNNITTIMAQSFLSVGITTLMWIFGGFGLAFGRDIGGFIGNPADFFLMKHVSSVTDLFHGATIPFLMFFLYQLMFIIITVPLMTGAFAGRLDLKGYVLLLIFWNLLIYFPVCHWIWLLSMYFDPWSEKNSSV